MDATRLVHELRVHQAELELQNEELRRAQADLTWARDQFSVLYDFAPVGYVTIDADGSIVHANLTAARLLDITRSDLIGKKLTQFVGPASQDALYLLQRAVRTYPDQQTCELVLARADRSTFPVELTLAAADTALAGGGRWRGAFSDVTARHQSEQARRESERRFVALATLAPVGIICADREGRLTYANERVAALTGLPPDRMLGTPWTQYLHPKDRGSVGRQLRQALAGNDTVQMEFRWVHADGHVSWVLGEVVPDRDASGTTTGVIGTLTDMTSAKHTSEALHERHEERLLQAASQGVLTVDPDGIIVMANRAADHMFGVPRGTLVGRPIEHLMPGPLRAQHTSDRATYRSSASPRSMGAGRDLVAQRPDGSTFPCEIGLNPVETPSGWRTVAFVTDITDRRRAADALRARTNELERRAEELRRLVSEVTLAEHRTREALARTLHDGLQQLLYSASLKLARFTSQRVPDTDLVARARADLQDAIAAARSLSIELVPPVLKVLGLPAALEWLGPFMHDKYGVQVHVAVQERANPAIEDIRILLFESARELVFNAIKHAHVGHVDVDLALTADGALQLRVWDAGSGFEPAHLREPLQISQGGLGLARIRERLALLGGHFEMDSAPGQGARFTLTVPAERAGLLRRAEAVAATIGAGDTVEGGRLRLLLVDDHASVRQDLRAVLGDRPEFEVVGEAVDGLDAIDQARRLRPDVVVMDVSMPRMDGVEATRHLRAELPQVAVLGLSSQAGSRRRHAIEEAGAVGFVNKGNDPGPLIERLLALWAGGRSRWRLT